jgi:hypothetical protein
MKPRQARRHGADAYKLSIQGRLKSEHVAIKKTGPRMGPVK